jgi:uncharacterized membrane protein YadS
VEERKPWWTPLVRTEDYWAVWLGLGIIVFSLILYATGQTALLARVAVKQPSGWTSLDPIVTHVASVWPWYLVLFAGFLVIFAATIRIMGHRVSQYVPGFAVIYVASVLILILSTSRIARDYNLEAPLLALILGMAVGNLVKLPPWFDVSLRTEYYIKTGIVLLGATLPLTLIVSAGPVAFLQATIVSVATWLTIFLATTKLFKKEPEFGAVLGAGGAVCGVSASIAVGASVKARSEHIAISISLVTIWAIVMIFFIPLASRALGLPTAVAGAWVGTSEFADAAGFAAAQAYNPPMPEILQQAVDAAASGTATTEQLALVAEQKPLYDNENAIRAFTLMKVIGRDIWIGIWCFVLSIVSVTVWERKRAPGTGARVGPGVIWQRFPKFVIGFLIASVLMTIVVTSTGAESGPAYAALERDLIGPIKTLRTWTFVFTFLCIGLTTRFRELTRFGWQPFWAFAIGVAVNVPLGFLLSAVLFRDFWLAVR